MRGVRSTIRACIAVLNNWVRATSTVDVLRYSIAYRFSIILRVTTEYTTGPSISCTSNLLTQEEKYDILRNKLNPSNKKGREREKEGGGKRGDYRGV